MYKIIQNIGVCICIALITFGFAMDANAKRFGGGRSFGISRTTNSYAQKTRSFNNHSTQTLQQNQRPNLRSFLGPIAGFVMGGLLASLFMGHGLGSGILSWLLLIGVIYFLWQFIRHKFYPQRQVVTAPFDYDQKQQQTQTGRVYDVDPADVSTQWQASFDEENFLRQAKVLFLRLQAAYDAKNMADIRSFTTPEVFAEIQLQLNERGDAQNITEVMQLNAELIGHEIIMREMNASVRFSGTIKEAVNEPANAFTEIWHLKKSEQQNASWQVSGIQQESTL